MRIGFFPKFAWESIRQNKRLYFPYIFTGSLMVTMFYIMCFLSNSKAVGKMKGADVLHVTLPLGAIVIAVFAAMFLFYTNAFLIKQRYREFGLYNVLGMNKKNIYRVMLWETIFSGIGAISSGLLVGAILSKAAELVLLNLLRREVDFSLRVDASSISLTALLFAGIYGLLFLNSLIRVKRAKPLELMQNSRVGEKVLKRIWVFALLGALILAGAYYLAVTIDDPLTAVGMFFVAVLMVILGTYLLFISGSVVFCRLLQKNKRYYYKANHFVSVSSMVYRMKRNGAGLASICILLTMVLVMITSTGSLYFGFEDSLRASHPHGVTIEVNFTQYEGILPENLDKLRDIIRPFSDNGEDLQGVVECKIYGLFTEDGILTDFEKAGDVSLLDYKEIGYLSILSLKEYNTLTGQNKELLENECLLFRDHTRYSWDDFRMQYGESYHVREEIDAPSSSESAAVMATNANVYLVVTDLYSFVEPMFGKKDRFDESLMQYLWRTGLDPKDTDMESELVTKLDWTVYEALKADENDLYLASTNIRSREGGRISFLDMYGSLFFLGIMLSIVFLTAAVLIIYYKQMSEGYEDQARFDIMTKIGMTKKDIRTSINSQILTVFFLPLLFAGVHLGFAFPFVIRILRIFSFQNIGLSLLVNLVCFAAFGILYAFVYKITSGAYVAIVSNGKE